MEFKLCCFANGYLAKSKFHLKLEFYISFNGSLYIYNIFNFANSYFAKSKFDLMLEFYISFNGSLQARSSELNPVYFLRYH